MYIGRAIDTSTHDHHAIQIALSFSLPPPGNVSQQFIL